jgi:hypothetical protein
MRQQAKGGAQKAGLACPIRTDQANEFTLLNRQADIFDHRAKAPAHGQVFDGQ